MPTRRRRSRIDNRGVGYPRGPLAIEGRPRLCNGPGAGARIPDATVDRDGMPSRLHEALATPRFHLLLCGPTAPWNARQLACVRERFDVVIDVHTISPERDTSALRDPDGVLLRRLGARPSAQYLIRPDGHVAYRSAGTDLGPVIEHLGRWLPGTASQPRRTVDG